MRLIGNARMYAVAPEAEAAWRDLIDRVAGLAGVDLDYTPYPAPLPLEALWQRPDLGCVFMCGYPIAMRLADVVPIAAPIPAAAWAQGKPLYRSDLIVRREAPFERLEATFGGTLGWTVEHSHSGFNALRRHLLAYRRPGQDRVYRASIGQFVTARRILDSVVDGTIDIGPLDAYWHLLIRRHLPHLAERVRTLVATELAPIPSFVASADAPTASIEALRRAFVGSSREPWFGPLADKLCLAGFSPVDRDSYAPTMRWAREAEATGYRVPA